MKSQKRRNAIALNKSFLISPLIASSTALNISSVVFPPPVEAF